MMKPPGSLPGRSSWAMAPASSPRMRNAMMPMKPPLGGPSRDAPGASDQTGSLQPVVELLAQPLHADPAHDAAHHAPLLDEHDGRHLGDAEPLGDIGPLIDIDRLAAERVVVAAGLQHLIEKRLHPPARPGPRRREEDEDRPQVLSYLGRHCPAVPRPPRAKRGSSASSRTGHA